MEVKIKEIKIDIGNKELILTVEEAKLLLNELEKMINKQSFPIQINPCKWPNCTRRYEIWCGGGTTSAGHPNPYGNGTSPKYFNSWYVPNIPNKSY